MHPMPLKKDSKNPAIQHDQDGNPQFLCIARRMNSFSEPQGTPVEQFSTKLDPQIRIKAIDSTGLSSRFSNFLDKDLLNRNFCDLIHKADVAKVNAHFKETLATRSATSPLYRLKVIARVLN